MAMYLYGENVFETIAILHVLYAKEQAYTANRECEISAIFKAFDFKIMLKSCKLVTLILQL